tara:strand:- start:2270 stop:2761 length:492 start_codon:yes stop_codon:yes gene_type:complete
MKQLYTTKQIFGGFLLAILFIMVFILNFLKKEYTMLFTPILFGLTLCLLGYILILNEIITTKKNLLLKKDKHIFKTCPEDYSTEVNFLGKIKEIKCLNDQKTIPFFYLQTEENKCNTDLGCFNKITNRQDKCENIKKFFSVEESQIDGKTLNNWSEYQNQCIL